MKLTMKERAERVEALEADEIRFRTNWHKHRDVTKNTVRAAYWLRLLIEVKGKLKYHRSLLGAVKLGPVGLREIKASEGFSPVPYWDKPGQRWTNGYGETLGIKPSTPRVTEAQAAKALETRTNRDYIGPLLAVTQKTGLKLKQRELDALASLLYNVGVGILDPGRTLGQALRSKDKKRIAAAFGAYVYASGERLPGLVARRERERKLFVGGK